MDGWSEDYLCRYHSLSNYHRYTPGLIAFVTVALPPLYTWPDCLRQWDHSLSHYHRYTPGLIAFITVTLPPLHTWPDCLRRWDCWCPRTTRRLFLTGLRRTARATGARELASCPCSLGSEDLGHAHSISPCNSPSHGAHNSSSVHNTHCLEIPSIPKICTCNIHRVSKKRPTFGLL